MNIIIWTMALTVAIILTIVKRKFNGLSAFIIVFTIVAILVSILNVITDEKAIKPSETTLDQISQINWSDEENLLKIGFEKDDDGYACRDFRHSIYIEKTEDIPKGVLQHKNLKYKFSEIGPGWFELSRLWTKEPYVTRRWYVYVDGLEISMSESENKNTPYVFEDVISALYKKQQNVP